MKRLIIVCEGATEQTFCNEILKEHLLDRGIKIECPTIKKSGGGIVSWSPLRKQIVKHLHEGDVFVTMLIDYYGIKRSGDYPGWEESLEIADKQEMIHFLVKKMKEDVEADMQSRFIPYIQLHEFEGLLFSDICAFQKTFDAVEYNQDKVLKIIQSFSNPELINQGPNTAPSKRLIDAIPGYDKVLYGNILATSLGLEKIRQHCPLFNEWVTILESL